MMLKGKHVILREIGKKDADSIDKYAKNREVSRYMGAHFPYPYTKKDALFFINETAKKHKEKSALRLGIQEVGKSDIIGMIGFENISQLDKNTEVGYWLGKPFWGKGYASEALSLLLEHGFKKLKFHKVYSLVYEPNLPSMNLLKKHSFVQEGLFKEHTKLTPRGKFLDQYRFGLLKSDWRK